MIVEQSVAPDYFITREKHGFNLIRIVKNEKIVLCSKETVSKCEEFFKEMNK